MTVSQVNDYSHKLLHAINNLLPQLSSKKAVLSPDTLQEIIQSPNSTLFTAVADDQILGMLTLVTVRIPTGIRCIIEDVVVDEKLRGKGAGKALMAAAEKKAAGLGCANIDLTSSPERLAANALYQKLGYRIRETNVYRKVLK